VLPSKCDRVEVQPGDLLHYVTWGGGGWGDPLERDPVLLALEVRRGLVTADGARHYGVVLGTDGTADPAATASLRAEMRAQRPAPGVFDFGPDIGTLRSRCVEETGLPPPRPPRFRA
jgi:N-methylhydantoinase B